MDRQVCSVYTTQYVTAVGLYRIVNLAHDVDVSQNALLHTCARHLKATGHVSISLSLQWLYVYKLPVSLHTVCPGS